MRENRQCRLLKNWGFPSIWMSTYWNNCEVVLLKSEHPLFETNASFPKLCHKFAFHNDTVLVSSNRGLGTRFSFVGPAMVKACNSSNHIICLTNDFFIIIELRMRRSLVKLLGLLKSMTKIVTWCLRTAKFARFSLSD